MRKLKFPIRFSVVPLLLLLILSVLRMFLAIELPNTTTIFSETIYPAIIDLVRFEILPYRVIGFPINVANVLIFVWGAVAVYLIAKYLYEYIGKFGSIMNWFERCERDKYAESLLAEEIGFDKHFHVYRNGSFSMAVATAIKPYIILPKVDFPPDELRAILLHEWKHIQDKDYLTEFIANIICFVFWWNPLVYVLRRNLCFMHELKCDQFAMSKGKRFKHFLGAILLLDRAKKEKTVESMDYEEVNANAFISDDDELVDRLEVLALHDQSRNKRIFTNLCYSIVLVALFFSSYMFTILPAFWDASGVYVSAEYLMEDYLETGGISRPEEAFAIDNGDGTFSLYFDGQFVEYVDDTHPFLSWLPIRTRDDE
ncbi:MAG: M56 family metallopeptidase [Defluviitaleaceae bacterium]|nr:M56 family metallopeptidase [Defluviitaleaceae bacterium]